MANSSGQVEALRVESLNFERWEGGGNAIFRN